MLSKNCQKFAKSPNRNICSQTFSKLARFLESSNRFANMATLLWLGYHGHMFCTLLFSCVLWTRCHTVLLDVTGASNVFFPVACVVWIWYCIERRATIIVRRQATTVFIGVRESISFGGGRGGGKNLPWK